MLCIIIGPSVHILNTNTNNELIDIEIEGLYYQFEYNDLKEYASVIALVRITDNLTVHNSNIYYNDDGVNTGISGFYGLREAQVLKYYKNDKRLGEFISIIEPAIITSDNEYIRSHGYDKMMKDNLYIVFLSDETASGELSIISANNGLVNISDINENTYKDIAIKSLLEFASNDLNSSKREVKSVLNSKITQISETRFNNMEKLIVDTDFGKIKLYYTDTADGRVDNIYIDEVFLLDYNN